MKQLLILSLILAIILVITLVFLVKTERQYDDCRFECNHLQTKMDRLEELGEYETALYQLLPSLGWTQLRTANEMIKQIKHREYEGYEQPLLGN